MPSDSAIIFILICLLMLVIICSLWMFVIGNAIAGPIGGYVGLAIVAALIFRFFYVRRND